MALPQIQLRLGGRAAMASDSLLEFTGIVRDGKIQLLIR
ncbi:hypothetical protein J2Z70_003659 [Paenibacillus silagei]|uniref:Uncharacterized protein n=1 Tax=Paenibacillus silagei TaxID=1670801 RepID=A0ABS4NTV8_9BACL|nr:hypothetical protein [Paenibacillus silagei]